MALRDLLVALRCSKGQYDPNKHSDSAATYPLGERYHMTPGQSDIIDSDLAEAARLIDWQEKRYSVLLGNAGMRTVHCDLTEAPHLLVAGTTGSGKSVCLNTILCSLLLKNGPGKLGLVLIDPKRVELARYKDLPHLLAPVATSPSAAASALRSLHAEMNARYERMEQEDALHVDELGLKHIVCVFDEYASFATDKEAGKTLVPLVNDLARLGRAAGIHLIIATQYPTADVVNSQIKSNIQTVICFRTISSRQSRTVLDTPGAELLNGKGDGLYRDPTGQMSHIQGLWCSKDQVKHLVDYWKREVTLRRFK